MAARTVPARDVGYSVKQCLAKRIGFGDGATGVVTVGVLPPKALVTAVSVAITTAFNAGTTNTLNLGTAADADGFASAIPTGTAGLIAADDLATSDDLYATAEVTVTATHAQSGTAATVGAGIVCVEYVVVG
ncbi:hypothetical protein [Chelatococcus reniformis]|uniref:Uncharacterized protein n=1 Tax=Chelatococcus reniformis TaxID=1494448 RepID=A0A916XBE4_9HYPH|nr:hypothetical protein [Chelatococcus reniformis]GGC58327.1 hypothetical protein GCM10010994_16590 [Chelatococcus reniformis]